LDLKRLILDEVVRLRIMDTEVKKALENFVEEPTILSRELVLVAACPKPSFVSWDYSKGIKQSCSAEKVEQKAFDEDFASFGGNLLPSEETPFLLMLLTLGLFCHWVAYLGSTHGFYGICCWFCCHRFFCEEYSVVAPSYS